jgi:hypothetical protein
MWKLFSINKKESLVDILKRYTEVEVREAIPLAFKGCHFSRNPNKKVLETTAGRMIVDMLCDEEMVTT